jgi:5-methylcytosine-specific restriction endonuclease McrBC GTP-binding regulatory subunit McrB
MAQKEIQKQTVDLNELRNKLHLEVKNNHELQERIDKTIDMFKEQEGELRDQLDQKEILIQSLTE